MILKRFFRLLKQRKVLFNKIPKYTVIFYSHKQPIIDKLVSEHLVDKAIQTEEELEFDYIKSLVEPYKKESSLIVIDDGIDKISKSLTKLFLEGNREC